MSKDTGQITLLDEGRVQTENGSSHRHQILIKVSYMIDVEAQLMTYHVTLNDRVVKRAYDVPYTFQELHTQAPETLFKYMYKGFPDLKIKVDEGEPHGQR